MIKVTKRRWWQIGTVLPFLMALFFVADIAGRFMPLELVAFRTFEPALSTPPAGGTGEFQPNKVTRMKGAYGDLASMANVRRLRQYHDEELHADEFGFRNSGARDTRYGGIVVGDSFAVGTAVAVADTLAGRLTQLSRTPFYNGGWNRHLAPAEMRYIAANLKIGSGIVVCELLERFIRRGAPPLDDSFSLLYSTPKAAERALGSTAFLPWLTDVQKKLSPAAVSPLQIVSLKVVKRLQNGRLQPNPYWDLVVHKRLSNGDDMLFLPEDLGPMRDGDALTSAWVKYLDWYNGRLQAQNLKLVVLLVPNKYTVYGPLAVPPSAMSANVRFLDGIDQQLRQRDIPVVDVTAAFRAAAAQELVQHRYLYWRDDTHWNAEGIALAADAVWNWMQHAGYSGTGPVAATINGYTSPISPPASSAVPDERTMPPRY